MVGSKAIWEWHLTPLYIIHTCNILLQWLKIVRYFRGSPSRNIVLCCNSLRVHQARGSVEVSLTHILYHRLCQPMSHSNLSTPSYIPYRHSLSWFELWNQEERNSEIGKNMLTCPTEHGRISRRS